MSPQQLAATEYADYADIAAAWAEAHQRTGSELSRIKRDAAIARCTAALARINAA
jgi:hypothetical protein